MDKADPGLVGNHWRWAKKIGFVDKLDHGIPPDDIDQGMFSTVRIPKCWFCRRYRLFFSVPIWVVLFRLLWEIAQEHGRSLGILVSISHLGRVCAMALHSRLVCSIVIQMLCFLILRVLLLGRVLIADSGGSFPFPVGAGCFSSSG